MLLLKSKGLVLHDEFYRFAWEDNNGDVTLNNLYQNISLLRKSLMKVSGHAHEWIITVPRKGFKINNSLVIEEQVQTETGQASSVKEVVMEEPSKAEYPEKISRTIPFYPLLMTVFTLVLCVTSFIGVEKMFFTSKAAEEMFSFYRKIGDCDLYINRDSRVPFIHQDLLSEIISHCQKFPYVYVTTYDIIQSTSVISCEKPLSDNLPACVSLRYIRGKDS